MPRGRLTAFDVYSGGGLLSGRLCVLERANKTVIGACENDLALAFMPSYAPILLGMLLQPCPVPSCVTQLQSVTLFTAKSMSILTQLQS